MIPARQAVADDAAELVRLRGMLFNDPDDQAWREPALRSLTERLGGGDPAIAAFVIGPPGGSLEACAVGTLEQRLGAPGNPSGLVGYVFNVVTDPDHRRRGHSRTCVTALLTWFRARGAGAVDLRATPLAEPLYESLGFRRAADPGMRLILS